MACSAAALSSVRASVSGSLCVQGTDSISHTAGTCASREREPDLELLLLEDERDRAGSAAARLGGVELRQRFQARERGLQPRAREPGVVAQRAVHAEPGAGDVGAPRCSCRSRRSRTANRVRGPMSRYQTLEVTANGPVMHVRLNRPDVRNAFNGVVVEELQAAFAAANTNDAARVVVLSGNGKSFSAGADLGKILVVEPHVNSLPKELEHANLQFADFEVAVKSANLIVLLVAHRAFMHVDRDMLKDIESKITSLIREGKSLEEVKAAKPTAAYDAKWGTGFIKGDQLTEFFYRSYKKAS